MDKIRVYGKAQNRTILGIVNAYLIMYPEATEADLNKAFPASLCAAPQVKALGKLFASPKEVARLSSKEQFWFLDDPILVSNGKKTKELIMNMLWQKSDFERAIEHAKKYDIVVADYKPANGFSKGGYTLEYLEGYSPKKTGGHLKLGGCVKTGVFLLLILFLIAIVLFSFLD